MGDVTSDDAAPKEGLAEPAAEVELLHGAPVRVGVGGQLVLHPGTEQLRDVVAELRSDGYWQCVDVCAVDYLIHPGRKDLPPGVVPERFEVVISLLDLTRHRRIRLRVQVAESDPRCPSIVAIHPGAEAPEREAYDLFGIVFDDHPDMTRILMPDDWDGHPLRKDAPSGRIPVQFKAASNVR